MTNHPKTAEEVAEQAVTVSLRTAFFGPTVTFCGLHAEPFYSDDSAVAYAESMRSRLAALISSDRRERERGYDPKEKWPDNIDRVLVKFDDDMLLVCDVEGLRAYKRNMVRWWPLPGPADASTEEK